jgi:PAS domain S-box-containing protein
MKNFRDISIRNKVTIISMMTCIIVLLLVLLIFTMIELTVSRRALVENAATLAEVIGTNSAAALTFKDQKAARETLAALSAESEILLAAIYTTDGRLFAQYHQVRSAFKALPAEMQAPDPIHEHETSSLLFLRVGRFKYAFHHNYLEVYAKIFLEGENLGQVYIRWSLAQLHTRLRWYVGLALLALLPSLFIAYLLASRLQRIITKPIMSLAQTMKVVSQERDYSVQVRKQSEDELGVLIEGFNEMLAQIKERDAALEQHREVLEQAVARRTAELTQSNRALEKTIEELNRTTRDLVKNERRLAYAQQVARLGYWEWRLDNDKLIWSGEVCRLFGLGGLEAEETGMARGAFIHLLHPEDGAAASRAMEASLLTGKAFRIDVRITAADGAWRILNLQGEVIRDPGGQPLKMTGTIQDITEHKEAEKALIESEEKYRALMNNASEGILLMDVDGNLLEANKKMLEMLDYSLDELLKLQFFQLIPSEEAEKAHTAFKDLLLLGAAEVDDSSLLRKDGKKIPIDITASLVRYAGKTVAQAILRDISERKKMEEERLLLSKLESLGLLAGGIAHDFNNILTAILGNITIARLDAQTGQRLEGDRLEEAEKACLRAQALAGQLLSFAKGGLPIKKITSAAELIKDSLNLALSGSKARSKLMIPEDLWPIEVDEGQISQVFNNLLINADQAMPEGGTITVAAENVTLGDELPLAPGDYVKVTVSDQGVGIPQNYLGKIFDPYFTTKQKGSGLGLATSYSIIRNNSGYISVESKVGKGTSFYVYLPAVQAGKLPQERVAPEVIMGQGRVLIMDDDEMVRDMLGEMLDKLGYEADSAVNGEEAIKKYQEALEANRPFSAAIFDLTVPGGMGGKEAISRLLEIDPQIKAIVSSGYSDDPIMANFQKFGFIGVISKPYRVIELSKILSEVLIRH